MLESLIDFLAGKPTLQLLLHHLSQQLCQEGNVCGVTLCLLDDEDHIRNVQNLGYGDEPIANTRIKIDSDLPIATSLRKQELIILNLESVGSESKVFKSACLIPLNSRTLLCLDFVNDYETTLSRQTFLECTRSVIKMFLTYQSKHYINEEDLLKSLTPRQELICRSILNGKTNLEIADDLAYSVSLIRQETMRIYSKFGVSGRAELRAKLANEMETYAK